VAPPRKENRTRDPGVIQVVLWEVGHLILQLPAGVNKDDSDFAGTNWDDRCRFEELHLSPEKVDCVAGGEVEEEVLGREDCGEDEPRRKKLREGMVDCGGAWRRLAGF